MRELTGHKINPANDTLRVTAVDEPGAGGANHAYVIEGLDSSKNPSRLTAAPNGEHVTILFQNGPISESGLNGLTQEVLLEIVADRLRSFQAGPFACKENAEALDALIVAQDWLHRRTAGRMSRGVEGRSVA